MLWALRHFPNARKDSALMTSLMTRATGRAECGAGHFAKTLGLASHDKALSILLEEVGR